MPIRILFAVIVLAGELSFQYAALRQPMIRSTLAGRASGGVSWSRG